MMAPAPAAGFSDRSLGKNQARVAYVLCKKDLQRALFILEKALAGYKKL